jgi:hypothetical protein
MKRCLATFLIVLSVLGPCQAQTWDPSLAAVRIKSHGASGTIIGTSKGKSWILSCCHMFFGSRDGVDPALLNRSLVMDGPEQPGAVFKGVAGSRVLAHDARLDLSLIELDNGPFFSVPVAAAGHKPGRLQSQGYDEMRWPVTLKSATFLGSFGTTTYTREKPWHGRSGGGLIDLDARVLIGVVQGYEVTGAERGLYVSLDGIVLFLRRHRPQLLQIQMQAPAPRLAPLCPPSR